MIKIFSEDKLRDRAPVLPNVVEELKSLKTEKFVIDVEAVIFRDDKALPREEMMMLVVGKEPIVEDVRFFIHDLLWLDDKAINELPYVQRLELLNKFLPEDTKHLIKMPSFIVNNRKEFDEALKKAYAYDFSEGAMAKSSDSQYLPGAARTVDWAKIKVVKEISVKIVGRMKKAMPFETIGRDQPNEDINGEKALKLYKRLQEKSKTWIFRCALKDSKEYVTIDTEDTVTKSDLEVKWNSKLSKPKWQGLDNPELWEMLEGFAHRQIGEQSFGATYAKSFDIEPKLGMIITVAPVQVIKFEGEDGKQHLSWMFPKVRELKPESKEPDDVKNLKHLIEIRKSI